MSGFLYGVALQWKMDIRSKSLLVTCYIIPLIFFLLMGGIFTSVMPDMRSTLIQSMIVMSVSMGAFIGLPPSLIETYGSDINKVYKANGEPVYLGLVTMFLSAFIHLMISCAVIVLLAPVLFEAVLPAQLPIFFFALAIYIIVSLSIGSILGLIIKKDACLFCGFLPAPHFEHQQDHDHGIDSRSRLIGSADYRRTDGGRTNPDGAVLLFIQKRQDCPQNG